LIVAASIAAAAPLTRALRAALERMPTLARPQVAVFAVALVAAVALFGVASLALAPVYLVRSAAIAAIGALFALLVAARSALAVVAARATRALVAFGALVVVLGFAACRNDHARFSVDQRYPAAGALASLLRDAVDIDRDGAAPAWLGGADCAEGNAAIGPAQREIPGDGIDNDCRGGDAKVVAPAPPSASAPPACAGDTPLSAIVVTIDALRADAVSARLTPALARLASDSTSYTRAYAAVPSTIHSLAAIFSGRAASDLGSDNLVAHDTIDLGKPLARRLKEAGFRTAAFNFFVLPAAITDGFDRDEFAWRDVNPKGIKNAYGSAQVTNAAIDYVSAHANERFFAWLHYPDAHAPYHDVPELRQATPNATPYEREVAYVDFHVGRLLAALERAGVLERIALVVTADHGEDLGQQGSEGHGALAYESSIRVPLFVRVPGCPAARVDAPVSLTQIAATIGQLTRVAIPGAPLDARPPVVSEALADHAFTRALVGDRFKLIVDVRNGGRALFDLETDPGETTDVYRANCDAARDAEARYQRWLDRP
jgi:arylsulfatase A-like enzyme